MKSKFPKFVLAFIALSFGLTSCEKETIQCTKCMYFNDKDFGKVENCIGNVFIETDEDFDKLVIELRKLGQKLTFNEKCI